MDTNEQFLFFCTNIGNEKLLKEEIRIFYPDFSPSYSRKGFLTYKNKGIHYDLNSISQLDLTFSTRAGICLGKTSPDELSKNFIELTTELGIEIGKCIIHNFSINTDYLLPVKDLLKKDFNEYSPINKTVIDLISLSDKEVWFGVHRVGKDTTNYPNSVVELSIPKEAPSKSYVKLAQTAELFQVNFDKSDSWLDFGCAPGGATYYLLTKGCRVWGIDPAKVDELILSHKKFTKITKAVQDLSQEDLPYRDIHWIHADLNLNPKQAIKEVLRLSKKYSNRLKGILFTVQVVKHEYIELIEEFEDLFFDWGFTSVSSKQVPSHKNEYVIFAKR